MIELPAVPLEISKSVGPFIRRAREMEAADPTISYFCKLYAIEIILTGKLHLKSAEVESFAMALLDDIERIKTEWQNESPEHFKLISDKDASSEHVQQFGVFIFNRAFLDVKNQTTTKSTVDKFLASVNFLTILKLWLNELPEEVDMKIKYAKFHAARIMKAYKNGEDPNDYITPEEEAEQKEIEAELDEMTNSTGTKSVDDTETAQLPSVPSFPTPPTTRTADLPTFVDDENEDIADGGAQTNSVVVLPTLPSPPSHITSNPLNLSSEENNELNEDDLPSVPTQVKDELGLPTPPTYIKGDGKDPLPSVPKGFEKPHFKPPASPPLPPQPVTQRKPSIGTSSNASRHTTTKADIKKILSDDEIVTEAQKRAKFAISALNYEDIPTAIHELELALKLLKGE